MPSRRTSFPSLGGTTELIICSCLLHLPMSWVLCKPGCSRSTRWPSTCHLFRWSTSGLPGSWGVLSYLCPAHETPAGPLRPLPLRHRGIAPAGQTTKAPTIRRFRGWFTRLQYPLSTLPHSDFPTMARLASDWVAALIGWDLNPLDSYSEFQARLYRRLSQRSRLRLARLSSVHCFVITSVSY